MLHAHACSGRKKAALAYVLTYTIGCVTKHFNNFSVLLVGRLFCGVATSLLNSAFESWLVAEHSKVHAPLWRTQLHQSSLTATRVKTCRLPCAAEL